LVLTGGLKLEHNDFTHLELQPSVRAIFAPAARQRVWAAVSRAVRTPDVVEGRRAVDIVDGMPVSGPGGGMYLPTLVGNPDLKSSVLWAYEAGWRVQLSPSLSADLAGFFNHYEGVIGRGEITRYDAGSPVGIAEMPWGNNVNGETQGGELSLNAVPSPQWRLTASYALLLAQLRGGSDASLLEHGSPRHQAILRSSWDAFDDGGLDTLWRYVSAIPGVGAYTTADARLWYRPRPWLELSLVGKNLLDPQHAEQGTELLAINSEAPRTALLRVEMRFQ
ncbi:MAG TPA: TonB-dependent receptor, partial [Nevskiaceae bacterium]|nr:TonB-dependent receptor [Nevskiaceae bacterium]